MIDLAYPFAGRWLVQNSPANRVPSHGTAEFAAAYAIDFVPVGAGGHTARFTLGSLLHPESPQRFPGFGRTITSPIAGTVVAADDSQADHPTYRGMPSVGYALSQRRRATAGWTALAGNHVWVQSGPVIVALCHLQHGSVEVAIGEHVDVGDRLGRCGNSGNSTEPHLHVQAFDNLDIDQAQAVPLTFAGSLPRGGEVVDGGAAAGGVGGVAD